LILLVIGYPEEIIIRKTIGVTFDNFIDSFSRDLKYFGYVPINHHGFAFNIKNALFDVGVFMDGHVAKLCLLNEIGNL
jgi:hypothetical protein